MEKAVYTEGNEDRKSIEAVKIYFMCVVFSCPPHLHPNRQLIRSVCNFVAESSMFYLTSHLRSTVLLGLSTQ